VEPWVASPEIRLWMGWSILCDGRAMQNSYHFTPIRN